MKIEDICKELSNKLFFDAENLKQKIAELAEVALNTLTVDAHGNLYWSNGKPETSTLVLFRVFPKGAMACKVEERTAICRPFEKCKAEMLADSVCITCHGEEGVFRKQDDNLTLCLCEQTEVGDSCYLPAFCGRKGRMLYGQQAETLLVLALAISCIRVAKTYNRAITIAVVNESSCGIEKTMAQIQLEKPQNLIISMIANEEKSVKVGNGAVVVMKDGNCVITPTVCDEVAYLAENAKIQTQKYVGDTKRGLAQLYLVGKTNQMAAIYLPVRAADDKIVEINLEDVEKTQNLLLKCMESFGIIKE